MQKIKLTRFEFRLSKYIVRDRTIADWLYSLPNASEAVKQVLARHIEKEEAGGG